jgi:hypothetical protein
VENATSSDATYGYLYGVSCMGATECFAVGYSYVGPNGSLPIKTLIERWNGTSWSIVASPNGYGGKNSELFGVSCATANTCFAVGCYFCAVRTGSSPLVERWNGKTWSILKTPDDFSSVSCPSPTSCVAPGGATLLWNGKTWSIASKLVPLGYSLSCTSATNCLAAGNGPIVQRWNGKTWSTVLDAPPGNSFGIDFSGVSCASATYCFALGTAVTGLLGFSAVADRWNGGTWTNVAIPAYDVQDGVSCASTTNCFAVGWAYNGVINGPDATSEHWNGATWSVVAAALPNGSASIFNAVSCTSPTNCVAVGSSYTALPSGNGFGPSTPLIEQWNGTTWAIVSGPNPATRHHR